MNKGTGEKNHICRDLLRVSEGKLMSIMAGRLAGVALEQ